MSKLSSLELQAYLPHRYPFLFIDRVIEIIPEHRITAMKNVSANERFFQGHFEGDPVMPGVLLIEAMAQAAHILAAYTDLPNAPSKEKYILASVDTLRFKHPVLPGDQLKITAEKKWEKLGFIQYKVEATVEQKLVCSGQIAVARKSSMRDAVDPIC